ncbi:MAG: Ig-like domain-containing protein [Clostridiales bacterium]|nr:Ig-like domain-containing protein [Clostridiales bacterium]
MRKTRKMIGACVLTLVLSMLSLTAAVSSRTAKASGGGVVFNFANGTGGWTVPQGVDYYFGREAMQIVAGEAGMPLYNDSLAIDGTDKDTLVVKMRVDAAAFTASAFTVNGGTPFTLAADITAGGTGYDYYTYTLSGGAFAVPSVTSLRFEPVSGAAPGDKAAIAFMAFCAAADRSGYQTDAYDPETDDPTNSLQILDMTEDNLFPKTPNKTVTGGNLTADLVMNNETPQQPGWRAQAISLDPLVSDGTTGTIAAREDGPGGSSYNVLNVSLKKVDPGSAFNQRLTLHYNGVKDANSPTLKGDYIVARIYSPVTANLLGGFSPEVAAVHATGTTGVAGIRVFYRADNDIEQQATSQIMTGKVFGNGANVLTQGWNMVYIPLAPAIRDTINTLRVDLGYQITSKFEQETIDLQLDWLMIGGKNDGTDANYPKGVWDKYASAPPEAPIEVASVTVSPASASMDTGSTTKLTATVLPSNADNKAVTWSSSNESVATVGADGLVTAVAAGTATITATSDDNNSITGTCTVTVSDVLAASISVSGSASMIVGGTQTLTATALPENATNKAVVWSTSNSEVATVGADGSVTARAAGDVTITATAADGGGASGDFNIEVTVSAVSVGGVSLNGSNMVLTIGNTERLTATVSPGNATDKTVTWSTSDNRVATVDADGLVTAVAAGTATVTVTTADGGKTASCTVTVSAVSVGGVSLDKQGMTLTIGNTERLTATVTPENATDKTVTWSTSDNRVATVSTDGLVTAVDAGTATITVTTADGGKTASCTVTVSAPVVAVTGVTISLAAKSLEIGGTQPLTATVSPGNATDKTVTWSTSDGAVATVDADGLVTAMAAGTATITVTTADGGKTASCTVTVSSVVSVAEITLSDSTAALKVGQTKQLTATVLPLNAADKTITWRSSDESVATVDQNGLVTALKAGLVTITAASSDNAKSASCDFDITTDQADETDDDRTGCGAAVSGAAFGGGFLTLIIPGLFLTVCPLRKRKEGMR